MEITRYRKMLGMSRAEMSRRFEIPVRTLEDWDAGRRNPPHWAEILLEKELIKMINNIVEKAQELDKFEQNIPDVCINDEVSIYDVWDGEGDNPIEDGSYSYLLTHDGEDGESNVDVSINYEFEKIDDEKVRITGIELI